MIFLERDSFWDFLSKVEVQTIDNIQTHPTFVSLNKVAMCSEDETAEVGIEVDAICVGEHDLEMLITPPAKILFEHNTRFLVFDGINELFGCMLMIHDEIQENITRYPAIVKTLYSIANNAIKYMQMVANDCDLIDQFEKLLKVV
jgi:hypothetical protein